MKLVKCPLCNPWCQEFVVACWCNTDSNEKPVCMGPGELECVRCHTPIPEDIQRRFEFLEKMRCI